MKTFKHGQEETEGEYVIYLSIYLSISLFHQALLAFIFLLLALF